jgi:16S rRNA (uracil1498-N3)-methyltransferase
MNIILFTNSDSDNNASTCNVILKKNDVRYKHIQNTLKPSLGDSLHVGRLNDRLGSGQIITMNSEEIILQCQLNQAPPQPSPIELVLALPRPKVLGRTIRSIVEMGVKKIHLIQSARVEKSYWTAHQLQTDYLNIRIQEALTQTKDTLWPTIEFHPYFKPFAEDELPGVIQNQSAWVAHPYTETPLPKQWKQNTCIAVGPEGGWVEFEIELFKKIGFNIGHFGQRTLSTGVFVPALLSHI